jgi:hypothetical protein
MDNRKHIMWRYFWTKNSRPKPITRTNQGH